MGRSRNFLLKTHNDYSRTFNGEPICDRASEDRIYQAFLRERGITPKNIDDLLEEKARKEARSNE